MSMEVTDTRSNVERTRDEHRHLKKKKKKKKEKQERSFKGDLNNKLK